MRKAAIKQKRELVLFYFYFSFILVLLHLCGPLNVTLRRELNVFMNGRRLKHDSQFITKDRTPSYREHLTRSDSKLKGR